MSVMTDFQAALDKFTTACTNATTNKVQQAAQADNADKIGSQAPADLNASALTYANNHIQSTSNPHGLTAAQAGTYDQPTIQNLANAQLPNGILPISSFGAPGATSVPFTVDTSTPGQAIFTLAAGVPLVMLGRTFTLGVLTTALQGGYIDRTVNVYIQFQSGTPKLTVSPYSTVESPDTMMIGTVTFDSSGNVTAKTVGPVIRLGNYRISTTAGPWSIPVSTGTPDAPATLAWK